ncbi:MAG: hypothetical protein AAF685_02460 [Cyanobacteria bacterium P01_C01_bin.89]
MLDQFLDFSPSFGVDTFFLLVVLVVLEAVLSADNAIALAAIAQGLEDPKVQRRALDLGLVVAFTLRVALILLATWIIHFWQFELVGAAYLLWLVFRYFTSGEDGESGSSFNFQGLWQAVPTIAFTDLAFSLDSVTTAIAISDQTWLVLTGGTIGVITLRFMAELFIRWLEEFTYLETAGYLTVALVGIRLTLRAMGEALDVGLWVPPDWLMITFIAAVFSWGFSKRNPDFVADGGSGDGAIAANSNSSLDSDADGANDEHSAKNNNGIKSATNAYETVAEAAADTAADVGETAEVETSE